MSHCRDCHTEVPAKRWYCPDCRLRRDREQDLRGKARKALRQIAVNFHKYPPLVNGHRVGSRGWYKAQIAAGHTPESMAALSGLPLKYVRLELKYMKAGAE